MSKNKIGIRMTATGKFCIFHGRNFVGEEVFQHTADGKATKAAGRVCTTVLRAAVLAQAALKEFPGCELTGAAAAVVKFEDKGHFVENLAKATKARAAAAKACEPSVIHAFAVEAFKLLNEPTEGDKFTAAVKAETERRTAALSKCEAGLSAAREALKRCERAIMENFSIVKAAADMME